MVNFLRKPLGCALVILAHGLLANQIYYQFFPTQAPQFTLPLGIWSLFSMYVFLTTFLLYRLLIKQEPFSKEFKKATSKYYTMIISAYALINFIWAKAIAEINPELAQKLIAKNVLDFVTIFGWVGTLSLTLVCMVIIVPFAYWINYGMLSLTNKIVNKSLKSKES